MSSAENPFPAFRPIHPVVIQSEPATAPERIRVLCSSGAIPGEAAPAGAAPFFAYLVYSPVIGLPSCPPKSS